MGRSPSGIKQPGGSRLNLTNKMKRIAVLQAEDHTGARAGLRTLWEAEAGFEFDTPAVKVASGTSIIYQR